MKTVIFIPFLLVLVFSSCKKRGCTEPNANNYNSSAEKDNGTCTYSDIEGNSYHAKKIGNQLWMTENLKVKTYRNGDIIPQIQDGNQWSVLTTGAWCYYENDPTKGVLYNWHAVNDPRGLAPEGWHIPSDAEWNTLINYLDPNADGGNNNNTAGGKMKSTGTQYWQSPNEDATNESGFSGLPGGRRNFYDAFDNYGSSGLWWSATEEDTYFAWYRTLGYGNGVVNRVSSSKDMGLSVRCVKD
jgi:uncharacterized protein (TIGR02145 family)